MNIESQTTSLEYSKRLKELGVKQESLYGWSLVISKLKHNEAVLTCAQAITHLLYNCHLQKDTYASAFTASELMELLPNRITTFDPEPFNSFRLNIMKSFYCPDPHNWKDMHNLYIVNYECDSTECRGEDAWLRRQLTKNINDEKFTDALAKMLIYLIENKLMELPE